MKKLFTLLVFTLLLPFLGALSCDPCSPEEGYFDINGIQLTPRVVSETAFPDGKFSREVQEGDSVEFSHYFLSAVLQASYYTQREREGASGAGTAFALSCQDSFISVEGFDTLYVITRYAWDRTRPAGDTLNDIADVALFYMDELWEFRRFDALAALKRASGDAIPYEVFNLRINREPEFKTTPHALKLVYHLRNGEVYEAETGNVWFR